MKKIFQDNDQMLKKHNLIDEDEIKNVGDYVEINDNDVVVDEMLPLNMNDPLNIYVHMYVHYQSIVQYVINNDQ
jgi:hypothetical protein